MKTENGCKGTVMNQNRHNHQVTNQKNHSASTKRTGRWQVIRIVLTVAIIGILVVLVIDSYREKTPQTDDKQKVPPAKAIDYRDLSSDFEFYETYFKKDFSKERRLLASIRNALKNGGGVEVESGYNFAFNSDFTLSYLTLYQAGKEYIRWGSIRDSLEASLDSIVEKLRAHERFGQFSVDDPSQTRILFEIVQSETPVNLNDLVFSYDSHKNKRKLKTNRFEPGITGLKCRHDGRTRWYTPIEATILSHLSKNHVLGYLAGDLRALPGAKKQSERIRALRDLNLTCQSLTSKAFVTYKNDIIPLYRGHPATIPFAKEKIKDNMLHAADWLVKNMNPDGSFLYYYDPIKDTIVDHAHPKRGIDNMYNNILRHSGGTITLIRGYELTPNKAYLDAAKRSLDFLIGQVKKREIDGKQAYYVFFNKKAKLGATGVGLAAIMRYYMVTGDERYNEYATGMVRHLLSRIEDDGEMIGYYIHPSYNGGQPILTPSAKEKKELFSFYYPGEALLGLALYEREMTIEPEFKKEIRTLCKRVLDFLIDLRPQRYRDLFTALPSDGWLMQAIEEWSKDADFQQKGYLDFVYNDANSMIDHMYNRKNSLYFDNPGTFFYNYGDHAYTDGARAEGLIAAYYLAQRMGRTELAEKFLQANIEVAKSLLYTYHSEESSFFHINPQKSIGSFRFKFTRQWVRVDSVQHTACFYARLYKVL